MAEFKGNFFFFNRSEIQIDCNELWEQSLGWAGLRNLVNKSRQLSNSWMNIKRSLAAAAEQVHFVEYQMNLSSSPQASQWTADWK